MLVDVQDLIAALAARKLTLAVAEGDTGGLLLERLTAVPGSSAVVLGGVVAYADGLKREVLGVSAELLRQHGAVSAEAARAMAEGVRRVTDADIGLATTGIAGPGGATPTKPVGLAYVAAAWRGTAASPAETDTGIEVKVEVEVEVEVREHRW